MKKKPTTIEAENLHRLALEAAQAAEAQHAAAIEAKTSADARALEDADLEKAVRAVGDAAVRIDVAARRLELARQRVAAAAEGLKKAQVEELEAELVEAEARLTDADGVADALLHDALTQLAPALNAVREAQLHRDRLVGGLRALGVEAQVEDEGPVGHHIRITEVTLEDVRAAVRAGRTVPVPSVDVYATVGPLIAFLRDEPRRLAEAAVEAEKMERLRAQERRDRRLAGQEGPEARDEERALLAREAASSGLFGHPVDAQPLARRSFDFANEVA